MSDNNRGHTNTNSANGALGADLSGLLEKAARGDLEAQRDIRNACADAVRHPQAEIPNYDLLAAYSIMMARLSAAQGDESDTRYLAAALLSAAEYFGVRGRHPLADSFAAEALAICERLALDGDGVAANAVEEIIGFAPFIVEPAKLLLARSDS